jgi:hypothetical protein
MAGPTLRIYDVNGKSVRGFEDAVDWTMSTKLPGGCEAISCRVDGSFDWRFNQQADSQLDYAEVTDPSGELIWSGAVDALDFARYESRVSFRGWWYTLGDLIFGWDAARYPTPTYPDTIIADIAREAGARLDPTLSGILHNPVDVGAASGSSLAQFDLRSALDVLVDLSQIGGTADEQWFPAVWADRRMVYAPLSDQAKWRVSWRDFDDGWTFSLDPKSVYSSVVVTYTDPDGNEARYRGHDAFIQSGVLHGRERTFTLPLPTNVRYTQSAAVRIARRFLDDHARPQVRSGAITLRTDRIDRIGGNPQPAYLVRAGDVFLVDDFPAPDDDWDGRPDGLRAFVAMHTKWDAATGRIELTPDQAGRDAVGVLTKLLGQVPKAAA